VTTTAEELYRIGDVAAQVGVTVRTIRYYEELGLVEGSDERPKGGHRLYRDTDVARLRELVRLRDLLGLSLDELTTLADAAKVQHCLQNRWDASLSDEDRLQVMREAIPHVERQLELVRARQELLADFAHELTDKLVTMRARLP
jgi:DNA-binding transcriptional MerR regulator